MLKNSNFEEILEREMQMKNHSVEILSHEDF